MLKALGRGKLPAPGELLRGGGLLFISSTLVNVGNYVFNIVLGRWLGPAAFADASLMVTLLLLFSFVAAALIMVTSKFVATHHALDSGDGKVVLRGQGVALQRWLSRLAWTSGLGFALVFAGLSPLLRDFFHVASALPLAVLGFGVPIYLAVSVDRGALQGRTRFGRLAASYQAEMWSRLIIAVALLALGLEVNGVVAALLVSLAVALVVARAPTDALATTDEVAAVSADERRAVGRFALAAGGALIGQILINNSDVLVVKHFFAAEDAGQYAALALIGRIVFFATWSVVTTLFPIVAQRHARGERHHHLLANSLGLVGAVSAAIVIAAYAAPDFIVRLLFGAAYLPVAPLVWLYALATAFYALANVIINYRLSAGNKLGSVFAICGGVAQVAALWLYHATLRDVVLIQVVLMACLFGAVLFWDLILYRRERAKSSPQHP